MAGLGHSITHSRNMEIEQSLGCMTVARIHCGDRYHDTAKALCLLDTSKNIRRFPRTTDSDQHISFCHPPPQRFSKDLHITEIIGDRRDQGKIRKNLCPDVSVFSKVCSDMAGHGSARTVADQEDGFPCRPNLEGMLLPLGKRSHRVSLLHRLSSRR